MGYPSWLTRCAIVALLGMRSVAQQTPQVYNIDGDSSDVTEWGATCTNRMIAVTLERTSEEEFTLESYSQELFRALTDRKIVIGGTYNISTRICMPETRRYDTIQVLAHGATYSKLMWEFPYQPANYSWNKRMNEAGYATFSFDLLGAGNSSKPDAFREVQTQSQVEISRQFIEGLKAGTIDGIQWNRVAFAGYSIGAAMGNSLAIQYPDLVDQLILIGLSWYEPYIYPALLMMFRGPANQLQPDRFGDIPNNYFTMPSLEARRFSHLFGNFDPGVEEPDWDQLDCDTLGEAITFFLHTGEAPEYTGPVFLGNGDNDVTFCGPPSCEDKAMELYDKFPNATDHRVNVYQNTGHGVLFHRTGVHLMSDVLNFLQQHEPSFLNVTNPPLPRDPATGD